MKEKDNGDLKFDKNVLFWREFDVIDGKRVYGRSRTSLELEYEGDKGWNLEGVTVGALYRDLYDALWNALCEKLNASFTLSLKED